MTVFRKFETLEDWYAYASDVGRHPSPGVSIVKKPALINKAYKVERKATDTQRQTMINWDHNWNRKELYVGFLLYIPSDFDAPEWCNIFQLNQQNPHKRVIQLNYNVSGWTGNHQLQLVTWAPDDKWTLLYQTTLPRDQYIPIIIHGINGHTDGLVELWVDGVKVFNEQRDLSFDHESFDSLEIGVYCDLNNPELTLYFDEPVIADTLQDVIDALTPPPPTDFPCPFCPLIFGTQEALDIHIAEEHPEPPLEERMCILAFLCSSMGTSILLPSIRLFRSHLPQSTIKLYYGFSGKLMRQ